MTIAIFLSKEQIRVGTWLVRCGCTNVRHKITVGGTQEWWCQFSP